MGTTYTAFLCNQSTEKLNIDNTLTGEKGKKQFIKLNDICEQVYHDTATKTKTTLSISPKNLTLKNILTSEGEKSFHVVADCPTNTVETTITTIRQDEEGNELQKAMTGEKAEHAGRIPGYTFVKTETDENGNVKHIFKKNIVKVQTIRQDEEGNELQKTVTSEKAKEAGTIDGYTFVKTETDENGNVKHIFKKNIVKPNPVFITRTAGSVEEVCVTPEDKVNKISYIIDDNIWNIVIYLKGATEGQKIIFQGKKGIANKTFTINKNVISDGYDGKTRTHISLSDKNAWTINSLIAGVWNRDEGKITDYSAMILDNGNNALN